LKASRLILRRTVAHDACAAGAVTVNGAPARPGRQVVVGDTLTIRRNGRLTTVKVLATPERAPSKAEASGLYEVLQVEESAC
jgi:ribosomal 50S subunit-recycling heat shock protein